MSAITQAQKDTIIKDLDYLKQKIMAYGLDPKWASGANHDDPALAYAVEKTAINAAGVEMAAILSTWLT